MKVQVFQVSRHVFLVSRHVKKVSRHVQKVYGHVKKVSGHVFLVSRHVQKVYGHVKKVSGNFEIWRRGNTFGVSSSQMYCCMTAKHLLSIAGHRAVPDCVKPAGGGGFTQLFFQAAGCAGGCCQLRLSSQIGWIAATGGVTKRVFTQLACIGGS